MKIKYSSLPLLITAAVLTAAAQNTGITFAQHPAHKFLTAMLVKPHDNTKDGPILVDIEETLQEIQDTNRPETQIPRNGKVDVIVIFANPGTNADGNADVTWTLVQWNPAKKLQEKEAGLIGLRGQPPPAANTWAGIHECMTIEMTPTDASGDYTVAADVTDNTTGQTSRARTTFNVLP